MTTEPMFPILQPEPGCPSQIPWRWLDDGWARKNHGGQSLDGLAQRGGLGSCEAMAVIERRPWKRMTDAGAKLAAMLKNDSQLKEQAELVELRDNYRKAVNVIRALVIEAGGKASISDLSMAEAYGKELLQTRREDDRTYRLEVQ